MPPASVLRNTLHAGSVWKRSSTALRSLPGSPPCSTTYPTPSASSTFAASIAIVSHCENTTSLCSPAGFLSAPGQSVACVTSTTSATCGSSPTALVRAPPPVHAISSCTVATANTAACLGRSLASSRRASATTYAPMRLSMERDTRRPFGKSSAAPSSTPGSPTWTRPSASALSAAPTSIHRSSNFETLSSSSFFIMCTAFLPITPRTGPAGPSSSTRWPTSTCGSQPPIAAK